MNVSHVGVGPVKPLLFHKIGPLFSQNKALSRPVLVPFLRQYFAFQGAKQGTFRASAEDIV